MDMCCSVISHFMFIEYKVEPGKKISATIRIKRSKLKIDKSRESLLSPSLFSQFSAEKDIVGLLARVSDISFL